MQNESQSKDRSSASGRSSSKVTRISLLGFTRRPHLLALLPAICFSAASGVIEPAMPIFLGKFFNAFAAFDAGTISTDEFMHQVMLPVFAFSLIGALMILLRGGASTCWSVFGEMQARQVREELFQGLLDKDLEWFEMRERGVGNLLSRLQTQIRELQIATSLPMGNMLTYTVEGFAAMGVAFYHSWKLTLVILATLPVMAVTMHLLSRKLQPNILGQNRALLNASKVSHTAITHIAMVKCFNAQSMELLQYVNFVIEAAKSYEQQTRILSFQVGLVKFLTTITFIQGLWYGNILVHNGSLTAGKIITTFWATLMSVQAFQSLLPPLLTLEKGRVASSSLQSVLSAVLRGASTSRQEDGLYPDYCEGDICMSGVSFAYPARPEHNILHDCYLRFPARRTTFLVGHSGSGKSTLGNLLLRFYPISVGKISLDGNDMATLAPAFLRNNITLVQQQSILFNETILKNIAFGHQYHDHVAYEQIQDCIGAAGLQPTVAALPEGVMTLVGAGGMSLSGGQKQRVAIARARLRDTPILILDEATSALDYVSRRAVLDSLRSWRIGKTTIIITHDTSLINDNEYVYVLDGGHISSQGHKMNLPAKLHTNLEETPKQNPSLEFTFHLQTQSGEGLQGPPSFPERKVSIPSHRHARTRRDSLESQLQAIGQDRDSMVSRSMRRTHFLSGFVSNRASLVAALDSLTRPPIPAVPERFLGTQRRSISRFRPSRRSTASKPPQEAMLKQHEAGQNLDKALPKPQVFDTTDAYRRMSSGKDFAHFSELDRGPIPLRRLIGTVWPKLDGNARFKLVLGFTAVAVQGSMPPCFAIIMVSVFRTFYMDQWKTKALSRSLILLAIAFGDGGSSFLVKYLFEIVAQIWSNKIRVEAMRKILEQPRAWFDQEAHSPAYLTSALDRNAEDMRSLVGRFMPLIFYCVILTTVTVIWALITCWKLTIVILGTAPLGYGLTKAFDVVSTRWESRTDCAGDLIGDTFEETFTSIKTVRALTLESYFHRKYHLATDDAFAIGIRRSVYVGLLFGLSECTLYFILALVFYYGAGLAKTGDFTNPAILNAISLLTFASSAANGVINALPRIVSSVGAASRLLHLAEMPLRSHEYSGHLRLNRDDPETLKGPIHFINTTFRYPTRNSTSILKQLNLYIPAHQCTAIVGPSGSGKTTITSLLLGLYPPTPEHVARSASDAMNGPPSLTLSGRDIRTLDLPTLRDMISLVPQTPVIFSGTVRDNITYGMDPTSKRASQANIELAASQAGIHEFIMSLPERYETVIGDGGLGVSGGQAQRIVIARALVRRPKILILDEPTSALDAESMAVVKQSIEAILGRNKDSSISGKSKMTVIIITHAREMMEFADSVVVMEAGAVAEEGKFQELMAKKGKLWELLSAGDVNE